MNPLVSIIMGVYNGEKTLDSCIKSILNQTYTNWEFIICDDCSSDNTLKMLEDYHKQDERIIVLHNEKNMRLAATLNNCLAVAKGKYIARMDADDESCSERIDKEVAFLEAHPEYDVVGTNRIIFDDSGDKGIRTSVEYPTKEILLKNPPYAHPTIMMKKSVYDELGGYTSSKETMRAEDLELWFRFYENGYKGYNIQEPLYRYRESIEDYSKRTVKAGIQTAKVFMQGYKRIGIPVYKRMWALKPIMSALLPNNIMAKFQNRKLK